MLTIYGDAKSLDVVKIQAAGLLAGAEIVVKPKNEAPKTTTIEAIQHLGIIGVCSAGCMAVGTNSILRSIARNGMSRACYGIRVTDAGLVDSWLDVASTNAAAAPPTLTGMNKVLSNSTYLVRDRLTVADVSAVVAILNARTKNGQILDKFPAVERWLNTVIAHPVVSKVLEPFAATCVPKKEEKKEKKEEKPAAKEVDEDKEDVPPAPKVVDLLAQLPPSPFVMDQWKGKYSNIKTEEGLRNDAMKYFWENYDPEGYTLFYMKYNYEKAGEDLPISLLRSANLMGGFHQRCDIKQLRPHAFAVLQQFEHPTEGFGIQGVWLFRGPGVPQVLLDNNASIDSVDFRKMSHTDEADRKLVEDIWCSDADESHPEVKSCKVYK